MEKLLAKAIRIASIAHENQMDKGGNPYILHPLWVMDRVRHLGHEYMIVGVLHDVLEDSDWTLNDLHKEGFPVSITNALVLLTKTDEIEYDEYINRIYFNDLAREVKLRDLEHNSKITRLKDVRKKDFDRIKKYQLAYKYLQK